jgi:uncharacterized protein YbjT (DUF2867 family)
MADNKIIAVFGATGAQGGGLVRAILADVRGGFAARAITRDPESEKARALARLDAEVVAADMDDEESVAKALRGAHGAYFVTNFWEHFSPEKEKAQAHNCARAAKAAGTKHVIWSTLEDSRKFIPLTDDRMPTLQGQYKVPHFDGKGESDRFFAELGVPTTFLLTSFYWENLIYFGMAPKRDAEGRLGFTLPMGEEKLPGIGAEDIGRCAYGIFKSGSAFIGKTVGVAGEHLSGAEMAAALGAALDEPVSHTAVTPEAFRGFGFPAADDLGNMFQFNRDFSVAFRKARDVGVARTLNPQLQTFSRWLEENKSRIKIE